MKHFCSIITIYVAINRQKKSPTYMFTLTCLEFQASALFQNTIYNTTINH